jgi:hypothetical protein
MKRFLILGFLCSIGAATFATGLSADETTNSNDLELSIDFNDGTDFGTFDAPESVTPRESVSTLSVYSVSVCSGYDVKTPDESSGGIRPPIYSYVLNNVETKPSGICRTGWREPNKAPSSVSYVSSSSDNLSGTYFRYFLE